MENQYALMMAGFLNALTPTLLSCSYRLQWASSLAACRDCQLLWA